MLQTLVAPLAEPGAHALKQLHQQDQNDHRHQHHQVLIAVVAVVDGDLAQAAAADDATHGGVAKNGGQRDGDILDQGGNALGDHYLADDLHGGGAHALGSFDDITIHLAETALHQTCHKGERRRHQRNDGGRGAHGGADEQTGEGEDHDHQDQEGDGAQQVDDDVDDLHEPAGQGQDAVFLAGDQQHAQGQAKHQRQRRADHGDVKRLPDGKGQRGQHRHQVLYGLGGE